MHWTSTSEHPSEGSLTDTRGVSSSSLQLFCSFPSFVYREAGKLTLTPWEWKKFWLWRLCPDDQCTTYNKQCGKLQGSPVALQSSLSAWMPLIDHSFLMNWLEYRYSSRYFRYVFPRSFRDQSFKWHFTSSVLYEISELRPFGNVRQLSVGI